MPRLLVLVEGQTEERFVREILAGHLLGFGYSTVNSRLFGNPRHQRGRIISWQSAQQDVIRHLKEDRNVIVGTMVDYYGLKKDWPGRLDASGKGTTAAKASHVESALAADVTRIMGNDFRPWRFVPLVMMHEFEALLFSDPEGFAQEIGRSDLAQSFRKIRQRYGNPEDINDSAETAPSRQIMKHYPGYRKIVFGVNAAKQIGLPTIRRECPHFHDRLSYLEALPGQAALVQG